MKKSLLPFTLIFLLLFLTLAFASEKAGSFNGNIISRNLEPPLLWIECSYYELTTEHHIPFDITCTVVSAEGDPATGFGVVDENDDPIGNCSLEGDQIHWTFDPPCEWVWDGLTHTVSLYVENEPAGIVYPDVVLETISLNVTNTPPEISGDCGSYILATIGHTMEATFEATDGNNEMLDWSFTINSPLEGNIELIDGILFYSPCPADELAEFLSFTIIVTDCAGEYDACDIGVELGCGCMFYHDPNGDGDMNILDVVFIINYLYKDGPAPTYLPSADWNLDEVTNILDVVYLINFLYKDGPFAKHDYSNCGSDASYIKRCK